MPDLDVGPPVMGTTQDCLEHCALDDGCGGFFRDTEDDEIPALCRVKRTKLNVAGTNLEEMSAGIGYYKTDAGQEANAAVKPVTLPAVNWTGVATVTLPLQATSVQIELEFDVENLSFSNPLTEVSRQQIPQIIHLIWFGTQKPPSMVATWTVQFQEANPEWRVLVWMEEAIEEILINNLGCYQRAHDFREKSDLARLEILNQFGGVFIDADSIWLGKSLEPLLSATTATGFFSSFEPMEGNKEVNGFNDQEEFDVFKQWAPGAQAVMQNGVIGSVAGHILLQKSLTLVPQRCSKAPDRPFVTTGPYLLSFALAELQREHSVNRIVTILPHSMLFANFWHNTRNSGLHTLESVYKVAKYCAEESHAITFQLGLSTNARNSDYSDKEQGSSEQEVESPFWEVGKSAYFGPGTGG